MNVYQFCIAPESRAVRVLYKTFFFPQRDITDKLRHIPVSVTTSLGSPSETTRTSDADATNITPVLSLYQQTTALSEVKLSEYSC